MKKIILIISFLTLSFGFFRPGTISAGSLFHYSRMMQNDGNSNGDYDLIGTNPSTTFSMYSAKPSISYFILPSLSIDATLNYLTYKEVADQHDKTSYKGLGFGASYYMTKHIYIGAGLFIYTVEYDSSSWNDFEDTTDWINIHGGYLLSMARNVFLDLNCSYLKDEDNHSIFAFNAGIKAFF